MSGRARCSLLLSGVFCGLFFLYHYNISLFLDCQLFFLIIFRFVYLHKMEAQTLANIDKIKSLAKKQGLKLKFLCSQVGMTESYFSDVKNGKNTISDERLQIIADLLHTTPAYLKDETQTIEKPSLEEGPEWNVLLRRKNKRKTYLIPEEKLDLVEPLLEELEMKP